MRVWYSWAKSRQINESIKTMAPATLDGVLQKFYLEVRKQDGSEYEPDSLKVMQAALERYLSTQKYPYSLINSLEFSSSRAVLEAKAKQLRMNGYGKRKNRALPYNSAEEESFWSSGLLGDHDGVALTNVNFKNLSEHFRYWHTCILIKIYFFEKKIFMRLASTSKVETSHFFALESISYVNKYSKTEILAFCYWHN